MENLQKNTSGVWSDLPTWAKGVIAVAVTGTLVFVGYKIYKKVNVSEQDKEEKQRREEEEKLLKEETVKEQKKLNRTYQKSQYISFANNIFNLFNGCMDTDFGASDYSKAAIILKSMKNDLDVAELINAYGTRQRTCLGFDVKGKDSLMTTIGEVWKSPFYSKMKENINNDWANKHIKYRV